MSVAPRFTARGRSVKLSAKCGRSSPGPGGLAATARRLPLNQMKVMTNPAIASRRPSYINAVAGPRLAKTVLVGLIGINLVGTLGLQAAPPLPGAIFTTNNVCSGVDLNIYAEKTDVYLDGGPSHP